MFPAAALLALLAVSDAPSAAERHALVPLANPLRGKFEIALYPITIPLFGGFTEHFGTTAAVTYFVRERFGFWVMGGYNWIRGESALASEIVTKARASVKPASTLLTVGNVAAGFEVSPIYGKFAAFNFGIVHFTGFLQGGVGAVWTVHQIRPVSALGEGNVSAATFGDTGAHLAWQVGGGLRFQFGERFAVRLALSDVIYSAQLTTVNGCGAADLTAMTALVIAGEPASAAAVSGPCAASGNNSTRSTFTRPEDIPLALRLVRDATSDVLHNLSLFVGVGVVF